MAYRRRQGITRVSTFKEEIHHPPDDSYSSSPSLAAQAIRASAAHRESSLSFAYGDSAFYRDRDPDCSRSKGSAFDEDASMKNDSKYGFWGVLARKAKAILEDDNICQQFESSTGKAGWQMLNTSTGGQFHQPYQSTENFRKLDNPTLRKGLDKITTSLNQIGDSFEKAFEEGRTMVENKTADIIQETRKLHVRRKGCNFEAQNQVPDVHSSWQQPLQPIQPQIQTHQETQLKASRDVAMATAAKAKLLLRELKTVKADLAFAKERCSQLEEENKILRESRAKGVNPADDDLIRLQLETLLAEKARLAHENSIYARENRFLREIVEYHQLTMQDVVYLDEGIEEVTEVYPINIPSVSKMFSLSPTSPPQSPPSPSEIPPSETKEIFPEPILSQEDTDNSENEVSLKSNIPTPVVEDSERHSNEVSPKSKIPTLVVEDSERHSNEVSPKSKIPTPVVEDSERHSNEVSPKSNIPTPVAEDSERRSISSS